MAGFTFGSYPPRLTPPMFDICIILVQKFNSIKNYCSLFQNDKMLLNSKLYYRSIERHHSTVFDSKYFILINIRKQSSFCTPAFSPKPLSLFDCDIIVSSSVFDTAFGN